jgi:hypothetical protein
MHRALFIFAASLLMASCGGGGQAVKTVANRDFAVASYEQSLAAYQICAERNGGDSQKCSALARVLEADRKRFEKFSQGL